MRREVKSLRKQAKRVRTDADGSDDDEDENDYAAAHGRSDGEVQETENIWIETSLWTQVTRCMFNSSEPVRTIV